MNESPDTGQLVPATEEHLPLTDAAKEQIKLRAAFLNGIAIATFGVGGLAPVVTALSRDDMSGGTIGSLFVLSVVCLAVSGVVHSHAYRHLKGLDA